MRRLPGRKLWMILQKKNIFDEEFLSNFSMETSIDEESEIINGNLRILDAPFDII